MTDKQDINPSKFQFVKKNLLMLFRAFILPIFIAGLLLICIGFSSSGHEIDSRLDQTLTLASNNIAKILNDAKTITHYTDNSLLVLNRMLTLKNVDYADSLAIKQFSSFISSFVNSGTNIDSIYLYIENTEKRIFTSSMGFMLFDGLYDKDWFEKIQSIVENPQLQIRYKIDYSFEEPKPVLSYFYRFNGYNGGMVINFNLMEIKNMLNSLQYYDNQEISFFNSTENLLFSSSDSLDNTLTLEALEKNHKKMKILEMPLYKLIATTFIPNNTQMHLSLSQNTFTLVTILLLLIICIILSYVLSVRSYRQINQVSELFRCADNNLPLPVIKENDSDLFSTILQKVLKMFIENEYLQVQLSERKFRQEVAELQALQYQINPHFLYNSLQVVSYEILHSTHGRRTKANSMIEDISDIIRFSLGGKGSKVTLKEEMENCEKYIAIQQMRYQNSFNVFWEIDEELLAHQVLRLILQPIVENSIIHGIRYMKTGGIIRIKIKKRNERIWFSVFDNSRGMSEETLEQIRKKLLEREISYSAEHLGLQNCNSRLVLEYQEESAIKVFSKPGKCTLVLFSIPFDLNPC